MFLLRMDTRPYVSYSPMFFIFVLDNLFLKNVVKNDDENPARIAQERSDWKMTKFGVNSQK